MTAMGNGKMKMGAPDGAEVSPEKRFKLALVEEVESSESRDVGGKAVPLVYKCNDATAPQADVLGWITANQEEVEAKLKDHGAILFRGFPLQTAADFDKFVCAFKGWKDLSYDDSLSFAVRIKRSNRICTTNEGKTGGLVFHHEQAQSPKWPSNLFLLRVGSQARRWRPDWSVPVRLRAAGVGRGGARLYQKVRRVGGKVHNLYGRHIHRDRGWQVVEVLLFS